MIKKLMLLVPALAVLVTLVYIARCIYPAAVTIRQLLAENKELRRAITNLTAEEQIGYAKIISQEKRNGRFFTTMKFVETARNNKLEKILEKEYTIEGDIIHFDALIVKFGNKMVMDGREKALYLWRRVYGETMAPENGLPIEAAGLGPQRYKDLFRNLPMKHKELFWSNIWDLANNPDNLQEYDIQAIYGNVVYSKLVPGLIYIFKISPTGQVYPEVVPDM
jgi:hypothetical protein